MLRTVLALIGGTAVGLAFEPAGLVVLLPLGIAALAWSVHRAGPGTASLRGFLFGLAFMVTLLRWLDVIGTDAWLILSAFEALYFALAGAAMAVVSRLRAWPVWIAVVWLAAEVFRGSWPMGGFTWGRTGFATMDTPFERWLPWIGTNGVSFLVALTGTGLLWLLLEGRHRRRAAGLVLGAAAVTLATPWLAPMGAGTSPEGAARVAIVQGDVPGNGDDLLAYHRDVTRSHVGATRELARDVAAGREEQPDFVLWPENSTAVDPFRDPAIRTALADVGAEIGAPILVGTIVDAQDPTHVLNQGIVYDPVTGAGDRYTKHHPVPFGEYIPYRSFFGNFSFSRLSQVPRDMLSGTRTTPLRIDGIEVADVICFDVAYDDTITAQVRAGADLLAVQTSNAMFIHTGQIEQQWAISRVRAMETGRTVVVAAVNGRSGVIGPDGNVVADIDPRTRAVLSQDVALVSGTPPAMLIGPWAGRVSVVLALGAVLWVLLSYRSRRGKGRPEQSTPPLVSGAEPTQDAAVGVADVESREMT